MRGAELIGVELIWAELIGAELIWVGLIRALSICPCTDFSGDERLRPRMAPRIILRRSSRRTIGTYLAHRTCRNDPSIGSEFWFRSTEFGRESRLELGRRGVPTQRQFETFSH